MDSSNQWTIAFSLLIYARKKPCKDFLNPYKELNGDAMHRILMALNDSGPVHTYPDLFENASFLSVLGSRPHGDGVFSHRKRSFFENALQGGSFRKRRFPVLVWTCELFENADVTVLIYNPSEHALGSLGITWGHFVYLFSDFECTAFSCGRG